jgi:hypothetical protein
VLDYVLSFRLSENTAYLASVWSLFTLMQEHCVYYNANLASKAKSDQTLLSNCL